MHDLLRQAAQIGLVAGMRSLMAPALVSRRLTTSGRALPSASHLRVLSNPTTAKVLTVLAAGEWLGDKIPNMPNRIVAPEFLFRVASGAVCGAALAQTSQQQPARGAVAGALGAVVGTLAFFRLRQWLTHERGRPDWAVALAEDALAFSLGRATVTGAIAPAPAT